MKTLADFKRELRPGRKLKCFNHLYDKDMGIREVARVMSNQFTLWTDINGERKESYCDFPTKDNYKIEDNNKFVIYIPDLRGLSGDMREAAKTAPKRKILTYEFVD